MDTEAVSITVSSAEPAMAKRIYATIAVEIVPAGIPSARPQNWGAPES